MADEKKTTTTTDTTTTASDLSDKMKDVGDSVSSYAKKFGAETADAFDKAKEKILDIGDDIKDSDFVESLRNGYDDLKDRILGFFHDFDKDHVDEDVDDLKNKIDTMKQKVTDSDLDDESSEKINKKMEDVKSHLDDVATNVKK